MPNSYPSNTKASLAPLSDGAIGHLYRGELARADGWRTRLDTTVNWSISVSAAVITFSFSRPDAAPIPILAGIWLVGIFLIVETRRYRYYDFWYRRLRLIEDGLWAPLLRRELVDVDALRELAVDMERPQLQVTFVSALMVRVRRVYGALLLLLVMVYVMKLDVHPTPAKTFPEFIARATIGPVPGGLVLGALMILTCTVLVLYGLSFFARPPQGELRTRPRTRRMRLWESMSRPYARRSSRAARRARVGLH